MTTEPKGGGLLAGKRLLVTGVLSDTSIAFHVARIAQQEGAQVVLTSFGRALPITEAMAERLPAPAPVIRLDVTDQGDLDALPDAVAERLGGLDGIVHSIAFAPRSALGGAFLETTWQDAGTALEVSAYSLKALVTACLPLLEEGSSVVGLDFDAALAWPGYDWMGSPRPRSSRSPATWRCTSANGASVSTSSRRAWSAPRGALHPRSGAHGGDLAHPPATRLGRPRPGTDGESLRGAPLRLAAGHHRRDPARRRRTSRGHDMTGGGIDTFPAAAAAAGNVRPWNRSGVTATARERSAGAAGLFPSRGT